MFGKPKTKTLACPSMLLSEPLIKISCWNKYADQTGKLTTIAVVIPFLLCVICCLKQPIDFWRFRKEPLLSSWQGNTFLGSGLPKTLEGR